MAKLTIHEELALLRQEVEELRNKKDDITKQEENEKLQEEVAEHNELDMLKEKATEIIDSLKEGEEDVSKTLSNMYKDIKEEYENLSPATAVLLFALGTMFARSLSK